MGNRSVSKDRRGEASGRAPTLKRSSRVMPGLRGMPAGMMMTSAPSSAFSRPPSSGPKPTHCQGKQGGAMVSICSSCCACGLVRCVSFFRKLIPVLGELPPSTLDVEIVAEEVQLRPAVQRS